MRKAKDPIERALGTVHAALAPLTQEQRKLVLTAVRLAIDPPAPRVRKRQAPKVVVQ
jgi:hypothetical protein